MEGGGGGGCKNSEKYEKYIICLEVFVIFKKSTDIFSMIVDGVFFLQVRISKTILNFDFVFLIFPTYGLHVLGRVQKGRCVHVLWAGQCFLAQVNQYNLSLNNGMDDCGKTYKTLTKVNCQQPNQSAQGQSRKYPLPQNGTYFLFQKK